MKPRKIGATKRTMRMNGKMNKEIPEIACYPKILDSDEIDGICRCDAYDAAFSRCNGTKERDFCSCRGDKRDCDFDPEQRAKTNESLVNSLVKKNANLISSGLELLGFIKEAMDDSCSESAPLSAGKPCITLEELFEKQKDNQNKMLNKGLYDSWRKVSTVEAPVDDVAIASYHIQQLVSEIGEVLEADKRWKNMRKDKCDIAGKKEEIADCFIVLMNIAMFSGMSGSDLAQAISEKIEKVARRID